MVSGRLVAKTGPKGLNETAVKFIFILNVPVSLKGYLVLYYKLFPHAHYDALSISFEAVQWKSQYFAYNECKSQSSEGRILHNGIVA